MILLVNKYFFLCLLVVSAITGMQTAVAATYYVSSNGSASWNNCTDINTPCSPVVSMTNAVAGDIVYFRGGQYELYYDLSKAPAYYWYRGIWNPSNSGTSNNPVTFAAYPDETPVLNCHTTNQLDSGPRDVCRAFGNGDKDYIVFDGFTIIADNGLKMAGLIITGKNIGQRATGNIVRNCIVNGGSTVITSTDNREGIRMEETSNTLIQNCKIYNFRQINDWNNTAAIKMYFNDNATIEKVEIYNSSAGIYLKSDTDNSVFRYNYIHDSYAAIPGQVYTIRNSDNNRVYQNVIVNNSYIGIGIIQGEAATADGWEVYNNTIYNSYYGIIAAKGRWKIWNNIIAQNTNRSIRTYDGNILVESDHNQFGQSLFSVMIHVYAPDQTVYSTLSSWQSSGVLEGGANPGSGSVVSDQKFVNSSGSMNQLTDFELAPDSPSKATGRAGVDMGANIGNVGFKDNAGIVRPAPPALQVN